MHPMHTIAFQSRHTYKGAEIGITVPVKLGYGPDSVCFDAKLDTGAELCLFERAYAEMIGLDILSGQKVTLNTVNSKVIAYGHDVLISVLNLEFQLMVYFYEAPEIHRSVLGRKGWLNRTKLGIVDYDEILYLSPYGDS